MVSKSSDEDFFCLFLQSDELHGDHSEETWSHDKQLSPPHVTNHCWTRDPQYGVFGDQG